MNGFARRREATSHKRALTNARQRTTDQQWYQPTIRDVYAQVLEAKSMLDRIPDMHLAAAKREMYILEDILYQMVTDEVKK